ncbi:probable G-protein coupled receptor 139 [Ylistrum balloti]|uniref:probable G-protein coupled receptor 139 n=1 Tax=Ylistrum balloti TaxID=509963 RepID=UPI0029059170|nr:probable G-protein coupled receptor 139 [Ylistrum balloti]
MVEREQNTLIREILFRIQEMNQEERNLLISSLNLTSEDQLLNFFSDPIIPLEEFTAFRVHKYLLLYVPPVMIFIGTIGNILSLAVFRAYRGKVSTYTYLGALAIMDFLVIYIGLLRLWIAQLSDFDIKDQSNWTCKMVNFLGYVCSDSSVWIIVAVTVERYIAVCYPLKASNQCRIRKARFVVFVQILGLCIINLHFLWTLELNVVISDSTEQVCDANPRFSKLVNTIWPWIDAGIYSFLPISILSVLNGFIIQKVYIAKKNRKHLLTTNTKTCRRNKESFSSGEYQTEIASKRLTTMLLMVSFTFFLTTLPMNIILIMTKSWNEQTQQQKAAFYLAKTVSELLMYLNHTINFFLYCISGRKFRRQMCSLLSRCFVRNQNYDTTATEVRSMTRSKSSLSNLERFV